MVRLFSQVATIAFLFAIPLLNLAGVHWILGTFYSLSIGELDIADPAMALQAFLLAKEVYVPLLIAVIVPVVLAMTFGRVFCSWMCPHNTIAEWLDSLHHRMFKDHWRTVHRSAIPRNPHPVLSLGTLATLFVITLIAGIPLLSFLSSPGILSSQISQTILGMGIGAELSIVGGILAIEFALARRYWCKFLCPVGSVLALVRTRASLRVHHAADLCDCPPGSEPCSMACPFNLSPKQPFLYPSCINCGLCLVVCEKTGRGALTFRLGPTAGGSVEARITNPSQFLTMVASEKE
ncbi:MAG: 4Fe-4S binding protein [Bacteroidota bacterium]